MAHNIFLDTQILRSLSFNWQHPDLVSLRKRISKGSLRLLTTDIVVEESRNLLHAMHNEYQQAVTRLQNKSRIFPATHRARHLSTEIAEMDNDLDLVKSSVKRFFEELEAEWIPYKNDVERLFKMYFNGEPPFGARSKKAEFPDAANLMSLLEYASKQDSEIYVVSGDEDWERVSERHTQIKWLKSLGDALSLGVRLEWTDDDLWSDEELFEQIRICKSQLHKLISESLESESTVNLGDGNLDALNLLEVELLEYYTTDIREIDERTRCRGELVYDTTFFAEVSIDEPDGGAIFETDIAGVEDLTATIEFEFLTHQPEQIEIIQVSHTDALDLRVSTRY